MWNLAPHYDGGMIGLLPVLYINPESAEMDQRDFFDLKSSQTS